MAKKSFKTIKIDAMTFEQLDYLCKAMNRSKTAFLRELFNQIFECAGTFETLNVGYTVYGNSVRVEFSGRNRVVCGSFESPTNEKDSETDSRVIKESKEALEKANKHE